MEKTAVRRETKFLVGESVKQIGSAEEGEVTSIDRPVSGIVTYSVKLKSGPRTFREEELEAVKAEPHKQTAAEKRAAKDE